MSTTVKVRLTTDRAGGYGAIQHAGDIIEVDPATATRMLKSRQAEAVDASEHPARQAAVRTPQRRGTSKQNRGQAARSKG